jgi:hypothetical protein
MIVSPGAIILLIFISFPEIWVNQKQMQIYLKFVEVPPNLSKKSFLEGKVTAYFHIIY